MKKIAMMASIAVLVLGTTSCVKQKETQTTFRTNEALEAVNVKVQTVQTRDVDQIQEFTATVEADVVNNIAPQTPVRIRRINVEVGNRVAKGQTLVVLDDNSLAQAKIQLDNAELEFNRYAELYKVGGIFEERMGCSEGPCGPAAPRLREPGRECTPGEPHQRRGDCPQL